MRYTSRPTYAVLLRIARRDGTLLSYDRDRNLGRVATLRDGRQLCYEPAWLTMRQRMLEAGEGR